MNKLAELDELQRDLESKNTSLKKRETMLDERERKIEIMHRKLNKEKVYQTPIFFWFLNIFFMNSQNTEMFAVSPTRQSVMI